MRLSSKFHKATSEGFGGGPESRSEYKVVLFAFENMVQDFEKVDALLCMQAGPYAGADRRCANFWIGVFQDDLPPTTVDRSVNRKKQRVGRFLSNETAGVGRPREFNRVPVAAREKFFQQTPRVPPHENVIPFAGIAQPLIDDVNRGVD